MLKKLQFKFICINMVTVLAILLCIFGYLLLSTRANLREESMAALRAALVTELRPRFSAGSQGEVPEVKDTIPCFVTTVFRDGTIQLTGSAYYNAVGDSDYLTEITRQAIQSEADNGVLQNYGLRYLRVQLPIGVRVAFANTAREEATVKSLLRHCSLVGLAALVAFFLFSHLLSRWAVKPVAQAWQQQKQFVADASHELKTPLAVIMTNADLLHQIDGLPPEQSKYAGNILTVTRRMRRLVEQLLELARADNGAILSEVNRLDFSELVTGAALLFDPLFFEQGLLLDSDIAPGLFTSGSSEHLRRVVGILLDNAGKYSIPGGSTVITLARSSHNRCQLRVSNQGDALSREELENLFKRFYRADRVRSIGESYGLGLSIAQSIVTEHHGRIWAESKNGWNSFIVELPTV